MFELWVRREKDLWVFDDDIKGIINEPFVRGAEEVIDKVLLRKSKNKKLPEEATIVVSQKPFEGCRKTKLMGFDRETKWSEYLFEGKFKHFLCPVLLHYFEDPPKEIYFDIF